MKAPLWKNILSYCYEFVIEEAYSDHNPYLQVSLSRGQYQLCTENAIYSYGALYNNFAEAFKAVDLEKAAVDKVLILGLGLGSIPYILEKSMQKDYHYTGVEIDETVVYLANKYVLEALKSKVEIFCADAEIFAATCKQQFDLICVDLFLDAIIPKQFEQVTFLANLQQLLRPNGILLYNRLATTQADIDSSKLFFDGIFKDQFPAASYLPIEENWILVNRADALKKTSVN